MTKKATIKNIIKNSFLLSKFTFSPLFFSHPFKSTFSQTGEDCIISFIFDALNIHKPSYADIGAFNPFLFSNTAKFYYSGSHGINIEPNPDNFKLFQRYRKRDINLNIGIAKTTGSLKYYMMDVPTLNTFSEKDATSFVEKWGHKIIKVIDIPVDTIDNVIKKYSQGIYPDFISIDAEGFEMDIVERMFFLESKPKVICIETIEYTTTGIANTEVEATDFLLKNGYMLFATTYINSIFVLKELWEKR